MKKTRAPKRRRKPAETRPDCVVSVNTQEDATFRQAARLRKNERGLSELKLRGHIVQDGRRVKALARGIRENHVLHTLDMRHSDLGPNGAVVLVREGVAQNHTLRTLILSDSCVGETGAKELLAALKHINFTLTELDLSMSDSRQSIDYRILQHIEVHLERNRQLLQASVADPSLVAFRLAEPRLMGEHPVTKLARVEKEIQREQHKFHTACEAKWEDEEKKTAQEAEGVARENAEAAAAHEAMRSAERYTAKGKKARKRKGKHDSGGDSSDDDGDDNSDDDSDDDSDDESDDASDEDDSADNSDDDSEDIYDSDDSSRNNSKRKREPGRTKPSFITSMRKAFNDKVELRAARKLGYASVEERLDAEMKAAAEERLATTEAIREKRRAKLRTIIERDEKELARRHARARRNAARHDGTAALCAVLRRAAGAKVPARIREQGFGDGPLILALRNQGLVSGDAELLSLALCSGGGRGGSSVTALDLAHNAIGPSGAKALANALAALPNTTAHGRRGSVDVRSARRISVLSGGGSDSMGSSRPALVHLELWDNGIGDDGATALADALKYADEDGAAGGGSLTSLGLRHNGITDDGAKALAELLMPPQLSIYCSNGNVSLHAQHLNIQAQIEEKIEDGDEKDEVCDREGKTPEGHAEQRCTAPSDRQDQQHSDSGSESGSDLNQEWPSTIGWPTLAVLDLSMNSVTAGGARHLAASLRRNRALVALRIDGGGGGSQSVSGVGGIGESGCSAIAGALADNPASALTMLSAGGGSAVGEKGAQAFAAVLEASSGPPSIPAAAMNGMEHGVIAKARTGVPDTTFEPGNRIADVGPKTGHQSTGTHSKGSRFTHRRASAIGSGCVLQTLRLCAAGIGRGGCAALCRALNSPSCPLQQLDLSVGPPPAPPCASIEQRAAHVGSASAAFLRVAGETALLAPTLFFKPHASRGGGARAAFARGVARIGVACCPALHSALSTCGRLQHLELSGNALGGGGGCAAGEPERYSKDARGAALAAAVEARRAAHRGLHASEEDVPTGVSLFALGLRMSSSLRYLGLRSNALGTAGVNALASGLVGNSTLVALDLSCNGCGDQAMTSIAKALRVNYVLAALSLRDNEIGAAGVACLAAALNVNFSLAFLDLSVNEFGNAGHETISSLIKSKSRPCPFSVEMTGVVLSNSYHV